MWKVKEKLLMAKRKINWRGFCCKLLNFENERKFLMKSDKFYWQKKYWSYIKFQSYAEDNFGVEN